MNLKAFFSFFVKDSYYYLFLLAAIILYAITAYHSHGFYQGDAHYQIIEFANLKLGINGVNDMPWEYHEKIRPSLQPMIAYLFLKLFRIFNLNDPYAIAFMFRLLSCGLYLLVIHYFIKQTISQFSSKQVVKYYYFTSFFLYFMPYLSIQFSSENWSGIFLLLGLAYYFNSNEKLNNPIVLGLIFGTSFLFRFQIAFAIVTFFLWVLFVRKESFKFLSKNLLGIVIMVLFGTIIDTWFYQDIVFTPWNYFYQNIIEGKASSFGVSPWSFYYNEIINKSLYKLGVPIVIACLVTIFIKPKNVFIWIVLVYFFIHSLIPHKELRFIFSIVSLLPIIHVYAVEWWLRLFDKNKGLKKINQFFILGYGIVHVILVLGYSQYNENYIINGTTKFIYETYKGKEVRLNFYGDYYSADFCEEDYLPMKFYFDDSTKFVKLASLENLEFKIKKASDVDLFLIDQLSLDNDTKMKLDNLGYKLVFTGKPDWLVSLSKLKNNGDSTNSLLFVLEKS